MVQTLVNDTDTAVAGVDGDKVVAISGPAGAAVKFHASPDGGTTWVDVLGIPLDGLRPPESGRTLPAGGSAAYLFRPPFEVFGQIRVYANGAQGGNTKVWWGSALTNSNQGPIAPPALTQLPQALQSLPSVKNTNITTVGNGTLTAAAVAGGEVTRSGPVGAFTDTTDTAANLLAQFPQLGQGQGVEFLILNTVAFPLTLAAGAGVTLAGNTVLPGNCTGRFSLTATGAATVTVTGLWVNGLDGLPPSQFVSKSSGNGTLAAGDMEGAEFCVLASSGATAFTTRTAAQIIAQIPNWRIGDSYTLRVYNTNAGTLTLTGGTGVTITGTATIATAVWREYLVTYTGAGAVGMQNIGAGNAN